jgi:hypothetical protein
MFILASVYSVYCGAVRDSVVGDSGRMKLMDVG